MAHEIESRQVTCPVCGDDAATILEVLMRDKGGAVVQRIPRPGGFVCWNHCYPTDAQLSEIAKLV